MNFDEFDNGFEEEDDDLWTDRDYDLSDFTIDDVDLSDNKFLLNQALFEEEGRAAQEIEREERDFERLENEVEKENLLAEYEELKEKRRKTFRESRHLLKIKEELDHDSD